MWRQRAAFDRAAFSSVLLPIALRYMPFAIPQIRAFGCFATWPSSEDLARFRATSLVRRWANAEFHLDLTLLPLRAVGSWRGMDPLAGCRADPTSGPILILTHSKTRPGAFIRFARQSGAVADTLNTQNGHIWADGFMDRVSSLDTGTLSLWQQLTDSTMFAYTEAIHQQAIRQERKGRWFTESWFGRFEVGNASGGWPGLDMGRLLGTRISELNNSSEVAV